MKAWLRKRWELAKLIPFVLYAVITLDADELEDIEKEVQRIHRTMP